MKQLKITVVALTVLTSILATACAETSFALTARRTATQSSRQFEDCHNHKTVSRSITIEMSIQNMTTNNASFKVEWCFVAQRADNRKLVLFGHGEKSVDLTVQKSTATFTETSDVLLEHDPACAEMNPKRDGKMQGYVVWATAQDGTVRFAGSTASLIKVLKTPDTFEALLKDSEEWKNAR